MRMCKRKHVSMCWAPVFQMKGKAVGALFNQPGGGFLADDDGVAACIQACYRDQLWSSLLSLASTWCAAREAKVAAAASALYVQLFVVFEAALERQQVLHALHEHLGSGVSGQQDVALQVGGDPASGFWRLWMFQDTIQQPTERCQHGGPSSPRGLQGACLRSHDVLSCV